MKQQKSNLPDLAWLADVHDVNRLLNAEQPISVLHGRITDGLPVPFPEQHASCELNILLTGTLLHFSQRDQMRRKAGDLFLAGPGVPHYSTEHRYPLEWISVYFRSSLLLEQSPATESRQLLEQVMSIGLSSRRYIRPTAACRNVWVQSMKEMAKEFERRAFASQIRMRAILIDLLVGIVRSEQAGGRASQPKSPRADNWILAERALAYLHAHYSEPVYARDLAAAAGVNESSLPKLFRECYGMPWVQYLQNYRVQRAAALLCESDCSVMKAALTVGLEDLSHFTKAFRTYMGVSPSAFAKSRPTRPKSRSS